MFEEEKPISAGDILKQPEYISGLLNEYIMVSDSSMLGTYKNLIAAINLLSSYGWETISMAGDTNGNMYALIRSRNYKEKNDPEMGDE